MDLLDRTPAATTQSLAVRGLPDNPAQGRHLVPPAAPTSNGRLPASLPTLSLRNASSNTSLSASITTTPAHVISLVREAMLNALENEKSQAANASAVGANSPKLRSGVTIDLSRKNIQKLPAEVVDIVKGELERLALSHNQLSSLPARFTECTLLRYLNIRGNRIKEFPLPLCAMKSLEILDLGRNQIRTLPEEIAQLSSLKVLSVPRNQIRELPLCIADMMSLQVLKLEGNPISFPPKDVIRPQAGGLPIDGISRDTEVTEVICTVLIKKFLRQHAVAKRMDAEVISDGSSEGAETPRLPLRRLASGRFPIKVNGADVPEVGAPTRAQRSPIVKSRSHYRGLSQQHEGMAVRRPGVMPLTIGNINERLRSNSGTLWRSDCPDGRNRRMGIINQKTALATLDETRVNVRFSHYRGLSHGSAMQGSLLGTKSPTTPIEPDLQRATYVRRLSILPERRRDLNTYSSIPEAAKGILYSVFQIHPMIQALMELATDASAKRSSLEIVFYNTNSHVEELEQEIQKHDMAAMDGDHHSSSDEIIRRACRTLMSAYGHICSLLVDDMDSIVNNGDPRYIRTFLVLLYNSIMELRATLSYVATEDKQHRPTIPTSMDYSATIRPHIHRASPAPAMERPVVLSSHNETGQKQSLPRFITTSSAVPSPVVAPSPRFVRPRRSPTARDLGPESSAEDAQFSKIFYSLRKSADIMMQALPIFQVQLTNGCKNAMHQRISSELMQRWRRLIVMCSHTIKQAETLRNSPSLLRLQDLGATSRSDYWNQCINFIACWTRLITEIIDSTNKIRLPPDTKGRLKPIQRSMKETSTAIVQSPWHHLFRHAGEIGEVLSPTLMPKTPQSAALGPAMQATMATTPQSASFATVFHGSIFDRAEALLA